ncbi:ferric reductase NAD binding domain-containing protein [Rhodotorula diobovata]|uniref:Ferric reductase NAD binding domain-containing protein n=1 Tax=Rhodotorula diobovata TaxID=5288 RepID=A0A5C5FTG4_9BASI|nr:ferric reductase NAD binding domain-containing protein [Rhodotorula diobovata]
MVRFPSVLPRARSSIAYLLGTGPPSPPSQPVQDPLQSRIKSRSAFTRPLDLRHAPNSADDAHVVIPLTPTSASLVRRATCRRADVPPRRQNETEQDRLQGLMRSDTLVGGAASGDASGEDARAERWARVKVWLAHEGPSKLVFLLWVALQAGMLCLGVMRYDLGPNFTQARAAFGSTYVIARSSAFVLHVDIFFILLPVCRNFVSYLRRSPMNRAIPFEKSIAFHEIVAWSIVFWSIVHTVAHLLNSWWLAATMTSGPGTCFLGALMVNGTTGPFVTGWIMLALLGLMAWFAAEKRRRKHFQRFFYSHHLAVAFFFLWQLHGMFCMIRPDKPPYCAWSQIGVFWMFWSVGGLLYVSERILREVRSRHRTYLSKVVVHPGKTVELQIKKEKTMMRAGQYIMLNCPAVSLWQWHPFTLTSAPEEDHLSIHFRVVGDWTQALAEALGCEFDGRDNVSKEIAGEDAAVPLVTVLPRIMVDGPFGTASEDVLQFEVSLLVGAGIGVTPFASILKHIWYRFNNPEGEAMKLRKVYFFWICRDYASFEWFQSLLAAIEAQDLANHIEIHTYLTGRVPANDVLNIFANDVGNEFDAVTQLRSPTHYGRPNWNRIFASLADQHPATDVGTFFCGPEPLAKTLHKSCIKFTSGEKGKTRFLFSKERF